MKTSDFDFTLPQELIADHPSLQRGDDRLMSISVSKQEISHHRFGDIMELIPANALLVFNNSKVRKARLEAETEHGSLIEMLLIEPKGQDQWLVMVSKAKRQKIGRKYLLAHGVTASIVAEGMSEGTKIIQFNGLTEEYIEEHGQMPLPPYMHRDAKKLDDERYQTIYAKTIGSAAAPTAGLHFTEEILDRLEKKGVERAFATLHVGLGTFTPIRSEELTEHIMHTEHYTISQECARQINQAREDNRPIIAVGTTSCRLLESAMQESTNGLIMAGDGHSSIFIYPGYQFQCITGLITNFHTPKSTLLALVSALAGYDLIRESYTIAVDEEYRFFSYGDAMLILP